MGSVTLAKVADSFFLYNNGTTTGPQLMISGAYVGADQVGSWMPIGAEHNASGGYQVVWRNVPLDRYAVSTTDSNGNYTSATPNVTLNSIYVQSLEPGFNQDLNGDGHLGPITTNVETMGSVTLAKVADSFFLYNNGTTTGPQLMISGAYAGADQFGSWTPIGAEKSGSGYQVVWKNTAPGADQYVVWTTDSNGNFQSSGAVMSGSSPTLKSLESTFHQDFNGNGTIGATAPLMTSSADSADPIAPTMIL